MLPAPNASFDVDYGSDDKVYDEEEFDILNQTTGGSLFEWYLDDEDTLRTTSDANFTHEYDDPGTYPVTHIAENHHGCTDTTQKDIRIYSLEWLHVPNAM